MSMTIGGGFSPYISYSYTPPEPADMKDAADTGFDIGMDDIAPVDLSQVMPVSDMEQQVVTIKAAENVRGSDRDAFRRDHSTTQQDLREIQAVMMGFATRRALELQNFANT